MDQREEGFSFFSSSLKYTMRISSENEEHFFSLCHSMNSLYTCLYRFRDVAGNNLLPMILSASAFNSPMIEFSIPDYNEKIIKYFQTLNVVSCVPYEMDHRSVLQWTIGEKVPLSLWAHSTCTRGQPPSKLRSAVAHADKNPRNEELQLHTRLKRSYHGVGR